MREHARATFPALLMAMLLVAVLWAPAAAWAEQGGLARGDAALPAQAEEAPEVPAANAFTKSTAKLDVDKSQGWLVANGSYFFALASDTTQVVGSGGYVQAKTGAKAQKWKIKFDYNTQCYTITNAKSGKVLAAKGKGKKGSVLVEAKLKKKSQSLTKWSGVPNYTVPIPTQRWKLKSDKNGYYLVSAVNKTLVVDFSGGRAHLVKEKNAKESRFWFVGASGTYASDGLANATYSLKSQTGKGFLNIGSSSVKNNAQAKVGNALTLWGQMFDFEYVGGGYYKIANYNSGLALTAKGGKVFQSSYAKKTRPYQQWKPVIVGANGEVQLINRKTGRALAASGSHLVLAAASASDVSQRWSVNPTTTGLTTVGKKALRRANKKTSKTRHMIVIDMTAHEYFLFHKANKDKAGAPWVLEDTSRCSTGRGKITWQGVTSTGSYPNRVSGVPAKWCIWASHGSWIHSIVTYGPQGDNQMGWYISAGCIRLPYKQAEYVFKHTKTGTRIVRYY